MEKKPGAKTQLGTTRGRKAAPPPGADAPRDPFRLPFSLSLAYIAESFGNWGLTRDDTECGVPVTDAPPFVLAPGGPTTVHQAQRPRFVSASLK